MGARQTTTITCSADSNLNSALSRAGYAEITEREYVGLQRAYGSLLVHATVAEAGWARVSTLRGLRTAFLIETDDERFLVAAGEQVNEA